MNLIKKIIMGVIMAALISGLVGCNLVNVSETDAIAKSLSDKYNKDFVVTAIGNRYNYDTATAYAYAAEDPSLRFVINADSVGNLEYDSYAYRCVCRKVENIINDAFEKNGLSVENFVVFRIPNYNIPADITIKDYASTMNCDKVVSAVAVKSAHEAMSEKLIKAFEDVDKLLSGFTVTYRLYLLSESDFAKAKDIIRTETTIFDLLRLESYGLGDEISDYSVDVSAGKPDKTAHEIDENLFGEVT